MQLDLTCVEINTNVPDPKPIDNANDTKCFELNILGKIYLLRCPAHAYSQLIDKIVTMKSKAENLFDDSELSGSETESVSGVSICMEPAGYVSVRMQPR